MTKEEAMDRERKYLQRLDWVLQKHQPEEVITKARRELLAFYEDTGVLDPRPVQMIGRPNPTALPHPFQQGDRT